jgi:hypothetical protein
LVAGPVNQPRLRGFRDQAESLKLAALAAFFIGGFALFTLVASDLEA